MAQKSVLIIRNAAKGDFGGAETYPVSLATIVAKEGWHPKIVTGSPRLISFANKHNVEVIKGPWLRYQNWSGVRILLFPLYIVWQLYLTLWYTALLHKEKPDAIHIQSRDDFIAASLAGHFAKKQVVWTDHMDLRYVFQNISKPIKNPVGKLVFWAARFSDHLILISNNEYRLVTSHFKKSADLSNKIVIVKNGVLDKKSQYPDPPTDNKVFTFCLASRVIKNKGIGEAIEAFNSLSRERDNIELHVYGDGADMDYFTAKASENKNIIFHGHVDDSLTAINTSNVYILPSYQEGFSIALLEATMLGKAIIASDVDSNSEIIEDTKNGLLIPAHDSGSLKTAMTTLLDNPTMAERLGEAARNRYEREFNLQSKVVKEILPLYKR